MYDLGILSNNTLESIFFVLGKYLKLLRQSHTRLAEVLE